MFKNVKATIVVTKFNGVVCATHSNINIMYAINSALKHRSEFQNMYILVENYGITCDISKDTTKNDIIKRLAQYIKAKEI